MKKIMVCVCIVIFLMAFNGFIGVKAETENVPQNKPPTVMELAFLRELGPIILKTMENHGDIQLFTSGRIEKIIRNERNDFYDVTLRVIGYEGPINPPFKLIRITFRFPGKSTVYSVVHYEHRYITAEEFRKLSKYINR